MRGLFAIAVVVSWTAVAESSTTNVRLSRGLGPNAAIAGLDVVSTRVIGKGQSAQVRIELDFTAKGRTLLVDDQPVYRPRDSDENASKRIVIDRPLFAETPLDLLAIDERGVAELERWAFDVATADETQTRLGDFPPASPAVPAAAAEGRVPTERVALEPSSAPAASGSAHRRLSVGVETVSPSFRFQDGATQGAFKASARTAMGAQLALSTPIGPESSNAIFLEAAYVELDLAAATGDTLSEKRQPLVDFSAGFRAGLGKRQRWTVGSSLLYSRRFYLRRGFQGTLVPEGYEVPLLRLDASWQAWTVGRWTLGAEGFFAAGTGLAGGAVTVGLGLRWGLAMSSAWRFASSTVRLDGGLGGENQKTGVGSVDLSVVRVGLRMEWEL